MRGIPPPLRFIAVIVGSWLFLRAGVLLPPLWTERPAPPVQSPLKKVAHRATPNQAMLAENPPALVSRRAGAGASQPPLLQSPTIGWAPAALFRGTPVPAAPQAAPAPFIAPPPYAQPLPAVDREEPWAASRPAPEAAAASRWSASAWAFLRRGGAPALAPGGLLGGSQVGGRLLYRLNSGTARPIALSARVTAPVRQPKGAEAAVGLDWQPYARLPLHLLAERRQALGEEGRSAFGITLYGGVSDVPVLGRVRLDAYGQAGVVGARSRDRFADGSARLSIPVDERGKLRVGAGVWGAAQQGAKRLDVGPQASLRLPGASSIVIAVDWRLRAAGDAAPGSGPTMTLATDF